MHLGQDKISRHLLGLPNRGNDAVVSSIDKSGATNPSRAESAPAFRPSDSALDSALEEHVRARIDLLNAERDTCISEDAYRHRMGTLEDSFSTSRRNWTLTRTIMDMARRAGAAIEPLDWRAQFSELSVMLSSATIPEDMPRHAGRSLIETPDDSAAFLAEDALVLAHLDISRSYDWQQQMFWIQWKDETGKDAGYCLTIEGAEAEYEELADDGAWLTVTIERLRSDR